MDWAQLESASDIVGTQKDDVRTFLTVCNSAFKKPLFQLQGYRIREHPSDSNIFYVILQYPTEWQGTLDQLQDLRDYNRSRIQQITIIPKEDSDHCFIHVEWMKKAVSSSSRNTKRKLED